MSQTVQPLRFDHRQSGARAKASFREPLETLQRFRTALDNGDVDFGQNLIARNSGVIRVGDEVEVLARGPAKAYGAGESDDTPAPEAQQNATVEIEWQGVSLPAIISRSCWSSWSNRAFAYPTPVGRDCGSCRIRLEEGEVSALKKNAVAADGTILL
jgi:hypothetical protein